jgi:CxxC motif-containing protein
MIEKKVTCIICPVGCEVIVKGSERAVEELTGFQCKKGKTYATDEYLNPKRILTSTVKVRNYDYAVLPVRSDVPVPKSILFECMEIIKRTIVSAPVKKGQIVIENILGSGANIVASTSTH